MLRIAFTGVIYISPGRGKYPRLILDGFDFIMHIKEGARTRWRCARQNQKCRATLYTSGNTVQVKYSHNHPPHVSENGRTGELITKHVYIKRF